MLGTRIGTGRTGVFFWWIALPLLLLVFDPAWGDADVITIGGEPVTLTGSIRARWQVWNWFGPGAVVGNDNRVPIVVNLLKNGNDDNRYHFQVLVTRVGIGYQLEGVKTFVELMSPALLHLPDDALAPPPQGALGLGANYFQPHGNSYDASVYLKQGFVEFSDRIVKGLDLKGGRFEFFDGAEMTPEDPELKWLVTNRIQQRLIGNFGFSEVMRSFDGAVASYGTGAWKATAMYGVPTKGVFDLQGMDEIKRTDLAYASFNLGPNAVWGNALGRIFYIYYDDGRGIAKVDNRAAPLLKADTRRIEIHTVGADWARTFEAGSGEADVLLWGAGQLGAWGKLTHEAYAATAEAGYRLLSAPWKPWLRAGYTTTSGDGNPNDSTHGTFFQILPTARIYALFPFYNLMNLNDATGELVLFPASTAELRTTLHGLWLSSSKDLWYSGGGEFDNKLFGYVGRPSSGRSYLATLLDFQLTYRLSKNVATTFYYGHAFGGSVVSAIYPGGKEADFGYIEATFSL
jgi:hypothetical protein